LKKKIVQTFDFFEILNLKRKEKLIMIQNRA